MAMAMDMGMDMETMGKKTQSNSSVYLKTDLHTHILPCVDDGASNMDIALKLLRMQSERGVERVLLTPHFYPLRESVEGFLKKREKSYTELLACINDVAMPQLMLGAEVRFSPKLMELDLRQLTVGQSNYLLLELPDTRTAPLLDVVVETLVSQNIIPIFAHIERCATFRNDPALLLKYIRKGALAQISINALCGSKSNFAVACLQHGLAHVISSDIHKSTDLVDVVKLKKYAAIFERSDTFARAIWEDSPLPNFTATPLKRGLLGYR